MRTDAVCVCVWGLGGIFVRTCAVKATKFHQTFSHVNLQSCGSTRTRCDLCVVMICFFIVIQLSRPVAGPVRKVFTRVDLKV